MNSINEDIAVIRTSLNNLLDMFREFKEEQKNINEKLDARLNEISTTQARHSERLSLMSTFQAVFSVIIGGIATFLGQTK